MVVTEIRQEHILNLHNECSIYIGDKWIWLRIHKNAGTSMYDMIRDECINIAKENQEEQVKNWLDKIEEINLNEKFIWSFVRNPYDRFLSMSAMFSVHPNYFAAHFHKIRGRKGMIKRHTEPQHTFTHYNGHQIPDFIGRYETIKEDWRTVLQKINMPYLELPKKNTSKHENWKEVLNDEAKSFIRTFYHLDFKYFGYEK